MVKTTKRSRKFNTKTGGGAAKALEKKGTKLAKKGKLTMKRTSGSSGAKKEKGGKGSTPSTTGATSSRKEDAERAEQERASHDFLNSDNLGQLDMDSFFEKAVMGEKMDGTTTKTTMMKR